MIFNTLEREKLLSWFAYIIGGWNASPGTSVGRLSFEYDINNDEEIVRFLLREHEKTIKLPLTDEIIKLKAEVYDLQKKLNKN